MSPRRTGPLLVLIAVCSFLTIGVLVQTRYADFVSTTTAVIEITSNPTSDCFEFISSLNPPIEALLIDDTVLRAIHAQHCGNVGRKGIRIGVEKSKISKVITENAQFEVVPYEDDPRNDFLKFQDDVIRTVLRPNTTTFGRLAVPESIGKFLEMWRRSRHIECLGLQIPRKPMDKNAYIPKKKGIAALTGIRDTLLNYGMFSFLQGGSLLGWFRECSMIPHTYDVDVGVFVEDYNDIFLADLIRNRTDFQLSRRLGMVNDSYEFTVTPGFDSKISIDIFFMYTEGNRSWVGGTANTREKYRYFYPRYDPYCAASLMGHLFWVTCKPAIMLKNEYGPTWHIDHPTRSFSWYSSTRNSAQAGSWPEDVFMDKVYWTKFQNRTIFEFLGESP